VLTGNYNFTVNVTDTSGVINTTILTYSVVDNPLYALTFSSSVKQLASNTIRNLSYTIGITNNVGRRFIEHSTGIHEMSYTSSGDL
jgi:hypothetical protein